MLSLSLEADASAERGRPDGRRSGSTRAAREKHLGNAGQRFSSVARDALEISLISLSRFFFARHATFL